MESLKEFVRWVLWLGGVLAVVLGLLRLFLFTLWVVPNDSLALAAAIAPTLGPGDLVVVMHAGKPSTGDLVRCHHPELSEQWIIGRIAGEGGETVEVAQGRIRVNGRAAPTVTNCDPPAFSVVHPRSEEPITLKCDREELGGNNHMRLFGNPDTFGIKVPIQKKVEEGFYYLVSDNREYSLDSGSVGTIPVQSCEGMIVYRLWGQSGPLEASGRFTVID